MNVDGRPRYRRRRQRGSACDGRGRGQGRRGRSASGGDSLTGRTTTRALVAVGAYVAQDLRDAEGVMRPLLRRAALRLVLSPSRPARRLGSAYLRLDPPDPTELPERPDAIDATGTSSQPRALPPAASRAEQAPSDDRPAC